MRMWMIEDLTKMCKKHLLGEHGELHKFLHNWKKKHKVDGRIAGNAMEPLSYKKRHDDLAAEMIRRKYNHKSPLEQPDFSYLTEKYRNYKVDKEYNLKLLIERCEDCKKLSINPTIQIGENNINKY